MSEGFVVGPCPPRKADRPAARAKGMTCGTDYRPSQPERHTVSVQWLARVLGERRGGDWTILPHPAKGAERLVMIALANHADEAGTCYPSNEVIAGEAGLSGSEQARRVMKRCEEAGWVERTVNGAPDQRIAADRRPNLYRILPVGGPPSEGGPPTSRPSSAGSDGPPPQGVTPPIGRGGKPSVEPSVEPLGNASVLFEQFWMAFPRRHGKRIGKGEAERVWRRMTPNERDHARHAVGHYRAACDAPNGPLAQDAHRWLTKRRWEDWDTPAQVQPRVNGSRSAGFLKRAGQAPLAERIAAALGPPPDDQPALPIGDDR